MDIQKFHEAVGLELRILREHTLKIPRRELADTAGISPKTVQRIETGERPADLDQLARICEALNEDMSDLIGRALDRIGE